VKESPIQTSLAEFLSTENCQCLVLLFPRLHCIVHVCIQMWFSEIVLLISTIITVASSYQLMSPFNFFFLSGGWSMLSYVSNGVCRLSGYKILSECYLCCSDLLGHSFDMKVLPFYPWLLECFYIRNSRVRRGNSFGVLPKENNKCHHHFNRMWILASNNWSTSMLY
jgi:hypothetical protein